MSYCGKKYRLVLFDLDGLGRGGDQKGFLEKRIFKLSFVN